MTKKIVFLPLLTMLLTSCGEPIENKIKVITPSGAPALAFYDQGNSEYLTIDSTPTNVAAQLQKNEYDAVVFDSVNGLKSLKKNNNNTYALARIITGGNFFLVAINKEVDPETGKVPMPKDGDKIVSFGEKLIPDLVYSKLSKDYWHIDNKPTYLSSVSDTSAVLASGKQGGEDVDYVFTAEPILTTVMNKQDANTYGKLTVVSNIREDWKTLTGQDALAQAGLFVKKELLETRKDELDDFMNDLDERLNNAVNKPEVVKATLDAYGTIQEQATRFGFNSNIIYNVQKDKANKIGIVTKEEKVDVNEFLTSLGQDTFEETYFVNL